MMTGICKECEKGYHEWCPAVMGRSPQGPVFCTCYCGGDTSLGNVLNKEQIPPEVKAEFPELPPQ